ncbi:MAG: phosphatidylglycerophosphatase A [Candidatus Zixiibacteriota bacterium]|nr:MAG: phosphatidylglycerophosphatase A [candidate division Zixibacteria bacterium]
MKNQLVKFIATGLCSGYLKPWPGTWGTIPAWLIAFFLVKGNLFILLAVTVATLFISIWSSGAAEDMLGHDSRKIVIDEWAGMFVALLFVEYSREGYLIAFFAFRAFDVIKLPPASQFEKLPRGWGVTMDDIAAGVYANIFTHAVLWAIANYGELWAN